MKISKQQLIDMDACPPGLARFVQQTGGTDQPVDVASLVGGVNTSGDVTWLALKTLPTDRLEAFLCQCNLISCHTDDHTETVRMLRNGRHPELVQRFRWAAYRVAVKAGRPLANDMLRELFS